MGFFGIFNRSIFRKTNEEEPRWGNQLQRNKDEVNAEPDRLDTASKTNPNTEWRSGQKDNSNSNQLGWVKGKDLYDGEEDLGRA